MSRIRVLSENLANQIAAGEVVERPASVVKELVENAVDAGASRIEVQVAGNGTRLIRVLDDGCGMEQDDVLLSLERHATSKLSSSEDLACIRTLGFRGEAVPSIASVSKMTITSRPGSTALGMRAEVHFGKLVRAHEVGCPQGTVMEVRDLFGNVPARRKFLKSTATEISHVEEVVVACCLARPDLGMQFTVNDREVHNLPSAADSLERRVRRLIAKGGDDPFVAVKMDKTTAGIAISGYLLSPDGGQGASARLWLFVNGRPVRDRMLSHAVAEGLAGFMLKGRRPAGALFLTLPPAEVDVNVHPTKQEIRFRDGQSVHRLVAGAVGEGMVRYQEEVRYAVFGSPEISKVCDPPSRPDTDRYGHFFQGTFVHAAEPVPSNQYPLTFQHSPTESISRPATQDEEQVLPSVQKEAVGIDDLSMVKAACLHHGFRVIGQIQNTFILCEVGDGLVAVDQHAVQERILFETLKEQYHRDKVPSQSLLFPKMVELVGGNRLALEANGDDVARLGLEIQEFGGDSFAVKAVPALMAHLDPEEIVQGILDQFSEQSAAGGGRCATRAEDILATMACKAAIKAGQRLSQKEMEHLLMRILDSPVFSHCPHGRPVLKHFNGSAIKRWFHRT